MDLETDWQPADVPGTAEFIDWFGSWPSFHDAEVTSIQLVRTGSSRVDVQVFEKTRETNMKGEYRCEKHAVVTFALHDVCDMQITGFNHQNVLSGAFPAAIARGLHTYARGHVR